MDDPILQRLIDWGQAHPLVAAMLLTSTRARPTAILDPFSDYDIILAVQEVRPFFEDRAWLEHFGAVLALYRDPIRTENGSPRFAYVTQYEQKRLKIDFTVMQADLLRHVSDGLRQELDMGYRVLLDKDHLTDALPTPTYTAYLPTPPTEAHYLETIEVFFHEATYVAKNLWRDELLPAKYSFDHVMKQELLRQMLVWRMEIERGWKVRPGVLGKGLKKVTPPTMWQALESTYVGAGTKENWDALFRLINLYRTVAREVGDKLGYAYPHDLDSRMVQYLQRVRDLPR